MFARSRVHSFAILIVAAVIQWTDETPSLDRILDVVTLWYLTDTYPYSIFSYRSCSPRPHGPELT